MLSGPPRRALSKGLALPLVLSVMALLALLVAAVSTSSLGSLNTIKLRDQSARSLYAAEAGVAKAIRLLVGDSSFAGVQEEPAYTDLTRWSFEVYNNGDGSTPFAPNGAVIPFGTAYILSVGSGSDGRFERSVGVLVRTSSLGSGWPFAVGAGGDVRLQGGQKTIGGGLKANGPIRFISPTTVVPRGGEGRVLTSMSLQVSGPTRLDSGQDARSRGSISGNIQGAQQVVANDTTVDTEPFLLDYRTSPALAASEAGRIVLPNPDPARYYTPDPILDPDADPTLSADVIVHGSVPPVLDLGGGVHLFPNGAVFGNSNTIQGEGTMVAGGTGFVFERPLGSAGSPLRANILAVRDPAAPSQLPSIDFKNNSHIQGMVYAHGGIEAGSNMTIEGIVIAYEGDLFFGANVQLLLDGSALTAPGFEAFYGVSYGGGGGPGSSGPVEVLLWQRL